MIRSSDRSGIAVIVSVFLATFTATPLTEDASFLGVSWLLILLLGGAALGLRRARVEAPAVIGAQLAIWVGFLVVLSASMPGDDAHWYSHIASEWTAGIEHMQTQAAPMAQNDGVKLIFVTVIGAVMIATDVLVSGINRPVWALAPPATLWLVPALGLGTDTGVVSFACIAIGYLAILAAEGLNTTTRWTRGLSRDSGVGFGTATPVVWRAVGLIGGPALILTVLLGIIVPTLSLSGLGFGNGPGGDGPLQLTDPTLDLRRNLNQPQDKLVVRYHSDAPGGVYLRMASLPQFSTAGWGNVPMRLDSGEQLSQVPGLSEEPTEQRTTTISVLEFKSEYLPLPYATRTFSANGSWAFDPNSLVVLSMSRGDRANSIRNLTYTVKSVDIEPDGKDLAQALAGTPADSSVTAVSPRDLPDSLVKLTREVTAGADSAAEKAGAIQEYLRSGRFTYSTETLPGSGYGALENFLLKDRKGYCEQFATAMAMMARVVGIPSRVAVGFLPGERKGDTWEVTIRDMHAWPELYFAGFGWVRFEPTPASITGSAPPWTVPETTTPGGNPSDTPSLKPSTSVPSASSAPTLNPGQQPTQTGGNAGFSLGKTLLGTGIGLLVLLILAAPATIRLRRRTGRLSGSGPATERVEAAWDEIRDTVLDYGGRWPEGTPRTIGGEIGHRLDGEGSASMTQVATLVERSRYARTFTEQEMTGALPEMAQGIRRGIALPQSRWRRMKAVLIPRSLFRRRQ